MNFILCLSVFQLFAVSHCFYIIIDLDLLVGIHEFIYKACDYFNQI